jgi:hypothetical protein
VLKRERQLQHLPAATAAAAVVMRPSRRRILKALQALPLQVLHLACETGPFATYDVTAWPSGRPSRVMVSSAAGLIGSSRSPTVQGKSSNAKQGARQG